MKALTYIEIDVDFCQLRYGVGACSAVLGDDSESKCYNTASTCPVRQDYAPQSITLRFGVDSGFLPQDIDCIPCLKSADYTPSVVRPGVDLGERATLSCTFSDFRTTDSLLDPYVTERDYDPFEQGTYWGKFRSRNPYIVNRPIRLIRGFVGQTLAEMETRNFIIESFGGPSSSGVFSIKAHDVLKRLDSDRAQAPIISRGELASDITAVQTTIVLSPSGIGDLEYPASGKINIGGNEIVNFTRSGDTLSIVRAQNNTEPQEHDEGDICQLCLVYESQPPEAIIYDLVVNYAGIDPALIPYADWQQEVQFYIGRLYGAVIATPTPVKTLVNEMIEQIGLTLWTDEIAQQIRLQALRPVDSSAARYDDSTIMDSSFSVKDQPEKRVSQVWTYFSLVNPLEDLDDPNNFKSAVATADPMAELDYEQPAYKIVYSRWIGQFNRPAASRLNTLLLSRYRDAPRKVQFTLMSTVTTRPQLGRGYRVNAWPLQLPSGERFDMPVQLTSINNRGDTINVSAEELRFVEIDDPGGGGGTGQAIIIDVNTRNFHLREEYDRIYTPPQEGGELTVIIESNVIVGAEGTYVTNPQDPFPIFAPNRALMIGDWPDDFTISIINNGIIVGSGGAGGNTSYGPGQWVPLPHQRHGLAGGLAIYTRHPVTITNHGIIGGGGGGGAATITGLNDGGGGGGGAGDAVGAAGNGWTQSGQPGTLTTGGNSGGSGAGRGGDLGQPGSNSTGSAAGGVGGAPGNAIDGNSFVTFDVLGDVRGARVN